MPRQGGSGSVPEALAAGIDPLVVGRRVRSAVRASEAYIFTHPATRALFEQRAARIRAGFDAADAWRDV